MSFTLFSVAILFITAGFILHGAVRGARRGTKKTFLSLISIFTSLVTSIILSPYIARDLGAFFAKFFASFIGYGKSEYMDMFLEAVLAMLLSSVLFLALFAAVRLLLAALFPLVRLIVSAKMGRVKDKSGIKKPETPMYEKNHKKRGAAIGAICGLLVSVITVAPIVGTLTLVKDAATVIEKVDKTSLNIGGVGAELTALKKYASDGPGLVLYHMGGKLIYSSAASTFMAEESVYLVNELENAGAIVDDLLALAKIFEAPANASKEDVAKIDALCEHLGEARLMTVLLAEYLPQAAKAWLAGEAFMNIPKPELGMGMSSAFDALLSVCAETDLYSVEDNMVTLLRVYSILLESGILQAGNDFSAIFACLDESNLLEKLDAELAKNPNMEPVREYLSNIIMRIVAEQLFGSGLFTSEMLSELTVNLSAALSEIMEGEYESDEAKVADMMAYAKEYIGAYGITLPDSIAQTISSVLLERVEAGGELTPADIEAILRGFLG